MCRQHTLFESSRPLLAVLVLTAIATSVAQVLPSSRDLRPLALLLDSVPVGAVVVATVLVALRLRRASVPLNRLLIAVYGYFAGALIGALGVAHLAAVVIAAMDRQQFVYNFRFYALVLLGVLLMTTGFIAATQAAPLARGHRVAWCASLSVWAAILAINLPLAPLQRFAVVFSALAVLELVLLISIRRHFDGQGAHE